MKIVVVTQDAPMYLSSLLDGFVARISATEHEIKAIIAFSPLFGNDIGKEIKDRYLYYGSFDFVKFLFLSFKNKLCSLSWIMYNFSQ